MSYLADAHRDWHTVNGWRSGCPLDCAAADSMADYPEPEVVVAATVGDRTFGSLEAAKAYARTLAKDTGRVISLEVAR